MCGPSALAGFDPLGTFSRREKETLRSGDAGRRRAALLRDSQLRSFVLRGLRAWLRSADYLHARMAILECAVIGRLHGGDARLGLGFAGAFHR